MWLCSSSCGPVSSQFRRHRRRYVVRFHRRALSTHHDVVVTSSMLPPDPGHCQALISPDSLLSLTSIAAASACGFHRRQPRSWPPRRCEDLGLHGRRRQADGDKPQGPASKGEWSQWADDISEGEVGVQVRERRWRWRNNGGQLSGHTIVQRPRCDGLRRWPQSHGSSSWRRGGQGDEDSDDGTVSCQSRLRRVWSAVQRLYAVFVGYTAAAGVQRRGTACWPRRRRCGHVARLEPVSDVDGRSQLSCRRQCSRHGRCAVAAAVAVSVRQWLLRFHVDSRCRPSAACRAAFQQRQPRRLDYCNSLRRRRWRQATSSLPWHCCGDGSSVTERRSDCPDKGSRGTEADDGRPWRQWFSVRVWPVTRPTTVYLRPIPSAATTPPLTTAKRRLLPATIRLAAVDLQSPRPTAVIFPSAPSQRCLWSALWSAAAAARLWPRASATVDRVAGCCIQRHQSHDAAIADVWSRPQTSTNKTSTGQPRPARAVTRTVLPWNLLLSVGYRRRTILILTYTECPNKNDWD